MDRGNRHRGKTQAANSRTMRIALVFGILALICLLGILLIGIRGIEGVADLTLGGIVWLSSLAVLLVRRL